MSERSRSGRRPDAPRRPGRQRICVVADWWYPDLPGGAERTARDVAHHLAAAGADLFVLRPGVRDRSYLDGAVTVRQVRTLTLRARYEASLALRAFELARSWLTPYGSRRMAVEIARLEPDVLIVTNM